MPKGIKFHKVRDFFHFWPVSDGEEVFIHVKMKNFGMFFVFFLTFGVMTVFSEPIGKNCMIPSNIGNLTPVLDLCESKYLQIARNISNETLFKFFWFSLCLSTVATIWELTKPCLCSKYALLKKACQTIKVLPQLSPLVWPLPHMGSFQWGTIWPYTSSDIKNISSQSWKINFY